METRPQSQPQLPAQPSDIPHIVLFYDVNGTIILKGASIGNGGSPDYTLMQLLANNYSDVWDPAITEEKMTFASFCWSYLVPALAKQEEEEQKALMAAGLYKPARKPKEDQYYETYGEQLNPKGAGARVIRRKKSDATIQRELKQKRYHACILYFTEYLKSLNHQLYPLISSEFEKMKAASLEGDVFKSMINVILDLESRQVPYTVILRSYGADTNAVVKEIEARTGVKFPMRAQFRSGVLEHGAKPKFTGMYGKFAMAYGEDFDMDDDIDLDLDTEKEEDLGDDGYAKSADEMLALVKPHRHGVWDDDSGYWSSHKSTRRFGKPFPIDLNNPNVKSIFFDDCAVTEERVSPRPVGVELNKKGTDEFHEMLLKSGRIVPVDTAKAIMDPDYFRNFVYALVPQLASVPVVALPPKPEPKPKPVVSAARRPFFGSRTKAPVPPALAEPAAAPAPVVKTFRSR